MKSLFATLVIGLALASGVSAADFDDAELVELGRTYAQAINELDTRTLDSLVSAQHLAKNIADFVGDNEVQKQQLFNTFVQTVPQINQRLVAEFERQSARAVFLRVHEFDGMRGPLVRYTVGDGYNYVLMLPVRPSRNRDQVKIGDLYYATSGELLSKSIGLAVQLASSPSESFLGKMFGVNDVDENLVATFQEVGRLRQQNRLHDAFDVFDSMQGSVRNHRLILMNTIQIASQLDEGMYRAELNRLATHHKDDPRVAFMLLDHYFYESDFDSAMSIIDVMEQSYGSDAVIYLFRANVDSSRDRFESAVEYARTAVDYEPDNEDAQWSLLTALAQSDRYEESVGVLEVLESEFGYQFAREDFAAEPVYTDLVHSAEFDQWMASSGR